MHSMGAEGGCANCTKNYILKADFFTLQTTAKVVIYNHRARATAQNNFFFIGGQSYDDNSQY